MSPDGLSDAIESGIAKTSKQWWRDHGCALVKKAVQEYNSELLSDIQMATAIHTQGIWRAIHNLQQLVDQEPRESQLLTPPSDAVLNEVTTTGRDQFGELEQRLVGVERELRLMQEAAESRELAMQTHFEHVSGWAERMTELETHREEIQSEHVSHVQEREAMRQVIARDLINLARDGVRTKEDLESYHWVSTSEFICVSPSMDTATDEQSEYDKSDKVMSVVSDNPAKKMGELRCSDSYELQHSIWDAILFLGVKGLHWHEHFLLNVAFVINVILQSVFCLMVLHLGKDTQVLEDDATTHLEVWFEQADSGEVRGVCGSDLDHALSTSFLQMMLMDEARNYFEEAIWGVSWGPLLTMMVIALWSGTMVSHGRRLFDFTVALWEHTHFELADWNWRNASTTFTVHLKSVEINLITFPRFLLMCFSVVLQLSVITILLVFGCLWMAKTSSVTELLLNAVSLAFITETDELVFITIVPTIIKNFVKKAEPLPLKPPRTSLPPLRSVVSLLTIITSTVLFTVFPVRETSQRMAEVTSLCDDRRIA